MNWRSSVTMNTSNLKGFGRAFRFQVYFQRSKIMLLFFLVLAIVITIVTLYVVEAKIHKLAMRVGILFLVIALLMYGAFFLGGKFGVAMTKGMISTSYSRAFSDVMSHLYNLSDSGQQKRLHQDLKILKDELPTAIANHDYTLADLLSRLLTVEEVNGQRVYSSEYDSPNDEN